MRIDTGSQFGARAARRLKDELIYWLVTVGPDGAPQPSPVWALWDGATLLIYSRPDTPKLRNIGLRAHPSSHRDRSGSATASTKTAPRKAGVV